MKTEKIVHVKTCPICSKEFETTSARRVSCDDACSKELSKRNKAPVKYKAPIAETENSTIRSKNAFLLGGFRKEVA